MKIMKRRFITIGIIFIVLNTFLNAQTAKKNLFADIEKIIEEARNVGSSQLSPEFFKEAVDNFEDANELYRKNKSARDIREKLSNTREFIRKSLEVVQVAKVALKDALVAREDAIKVDASTYASEYFEEGEDILYYAAREVEKEDLDDARDLASEAEVSYRKAELKAIKDIILGEARQAIEQAEEADADKYCPNTFNYAVNLLQEVDELLVYNRYAKEEAQNKADESAYQARHADHLSREIQLIEDGEKTLEATFLQFEDMLSSIAANFDERLYFDEGLSEPVKLLLEKVSEMNRENRELIEENANLREEYNIVREKATTTSAELAQKRELEAKIDKIQMLFKLSEAKVVFDGENIVIRLHGLNFEPGRSIIMPEYFSLLTKVQNAIKEFPQNHILIEGHTDSKGLPAKNKQLSVARANAVREYIIANMGIERDQITSVGYGDSKPVASNKTREGRALNRRIDVIINLSK